MQNELCWDVFAKSGRVSDYLDYVINEKQQVSNAVKEERGQRERESDGDGVISRNHW